MRYVAVCGAGKASEAELRDAEEVGRELARRGAVVICGGLGGVMDAVARGAAEAGGTCVGVLPGATREGAGRHLSVALATGLGEARNTVIAIAADTVIAIGGGWGTLSEIAFARRLGKPVLALNTWEVDGLEKVASPAEAVERALGST